jgi:hypothetical protein
LIWGLREIAMICLGAAKGLVGLWLLIAKRPKKVPLHLADKTPAPTGMSEPTRLTIAIVTLIGGFHFVIWAFPPDVEGVQLNRNLWYVWILIGLSTVGISLWMDKVEGRNPPENGDT